MKPGCEAGIWVASPLQSTMHTHMRNNSHRDNRPAYMFSEEIRKPENMLEYRADKQNGIWINNVRLRLSFLIALGYHKLIHEYVFKHVCINSFGENELKLLHQFQDLAD